jgi:hypothetical protein
MQQIPGVARHVLAVMAILILAGCVPGNSSNSGCLPSPLEASPRNVAAGTTLTLVAPKFACGASYPTGKTYRLTLGLVGRAAPVDLGPFPVNSDGSFHAIVTIPRSASPGEAAISVTGSSFDNCTDTASSCAGYVAGFTILPASG